MRFDFNFTKVMARRQRFRGRKRIACWKNVVRSACLIAGLVPGALHAPAARAGDITIFAAASLKKALDEVVILFEAETGHHAAISYAGTPVLARQISLGAPADVFISASADWMDWLEQKEAIDKDRRFDLLSNQLVLIAHGSPAGPVDLDPTALRARVQQERVAMALVEAVPAGIYGKAALEHFGLWDQLSAQIVQTDNARTALALVASGEAPFGVVYATDALAEPRVSVIARFPADSHPDIRYPVATVSGRNSVPVDQFLQHLRSKPAASVFETHGFLMPEQRQ